MEASNATSNDDIVINHFCRQIFHALGYPDKNTAIVRRKWRVAATASWYLRQFYVNNSLLDHDPRIMMLCAIFLAGKIEDHFVNMEDLFRIFKKVPESRILESEILLLEGLEFNLKVFHPQNCVHTIIADMKRLAQSSQPSSLSEQDILNWKQKISPLTTLWLNKTEEYLILVQTSSLITKLDPLCIAIIVLLITGNIFCGSKATLKTIRDEDIDFEGHQHIVDAIKEAISGRWGTRSTTLDELY